MNPETFNQESNENKLFVHESTVQTENQSLLLECEIKKVSEKKKLLKTGFLRFYPVCIHYSKKKEFKSKKTLIYSERIFASFIFEKKTITLISFSNEGDQFDFLSSEKYYMNEIRELMKKKVIFKEFSSNFKFYKMLGKGGSANVYLCENIFEERKYAVKIISKMRYMQDDYKKKGGILKEIQMMRALQNHNFMQLDSVYESDQNFYLVLELFQGGNLKEMVKEKGPLSINDATIILNAIVNAIKLLHSKNIIHRDIKPENILFRKQQKSFHEYDIALADFGFAVNANEIPFFFPRCGTPGYAAPEVLQAKSSSCDYGFACDIFSLGITFFYMMTGKMPYTFTGYKDLMQKNQECSFDLENEIINKYDSTKNLLMEMLEENPKKRITAEQILRHEFFIHPYDLNDSDSEYIGLEGNMRKINMKQFSLKNINPMSPKTVSCNKKNANFGSFFGFELSSKEMAYDESTLSFHFNKPLFFGNLKTFKSLNKSITNENLLLTHNLKLLSDEIE